MTVKTKNHLIKTRKQKSNFFEFAILPAFGPLSDLASWTRMKPKFAGIYHHEDNHQTVPSVAEPPIQRLRRLPESALQRGQGCKMKTVALAFRQSLPPTRSYMTVPLGKS